MFFSVRNQFATLTKALKLAIVAASKCLLSRLQLMVFIKKIMIVKFSLFYIYVTYKSKEQTQTTRLGKKAQPAKMENTTSAEEEGDPQEQRCGGETVIDGEVRW
ncbi:hypothetical protein RIF29_19305 [Crotalaria pallida]|uniref:Uncharacterized protein n=1 Tax=Crotalaria pallida TaxID=3830 RepID=A0AAN9F3L3_CROPI